MYDCIGSRAAQLAATFPSPDMIAWYGTGSPDIQWTQEDLARFPNAVKVEIDQGFTGSPILSAQVRDVEGGAWTVSAAVDTTGWDVHRPTIYCNRSTLSSVIAEGWTGDVWLAWPGYQAAGPPVYNGVNVVAVQNIWAGDYDASVVYDASWPLPVPVVTSKAHLSLTIIGRTADLAWTSIDRATGYRVVYHASSASVEVLLATVAQPAIGGAVHLGKLPIPDGHGGSVLIWAEVGGLFVSAGSVNLP